LTTNTNAYGIDLNFQPLTVSPNWVIVAHSGVSGSGPTDTGGGGGHVIQEEGVVQTARGSLNFVGPAVAATDDAANDRTTVSVTTPNMIIIGPTDSIPGGTPANTVIVRRTS
jgi:hypothetical protein